MQTRHVRSSSFPLRFLLAGAVFGGLFAVAAAFVALGFLVPQSIASLGASRLDVTREVDRLIGRQRQHQRLGGARLYDHRLVSGDTGGARFNSSSSTRACS